METGGALMKLLQGYKVHRITYDNGPEFAEHYRVSSVLSSEGHLCNLYQSWEKGEGKTSMD